MGTAAWRNLVEAGLFAATVLLLLLGGWRRPGADRWWPMRGWRFAPLVWLLLALCVLFAALRLRGLVGAYA